MSVFRARAMLALVLPELNYDDREICEAAGIGIRHGLSTGKTSSYANLYPNPTDDAATLKYVLPENTEPLFRLFSLTGQLKWVTSLKANAGEYRFSTSALAPGVYKYEVITREGNTSIIGKLIIIR